MTVLARERVFAAWEAQLGGRYQHLTRNVVHTEARRLRRDAMEESDAYPLTLLPRLPSHALALLRELDLAKPEQTLAWSMAITDRAIERAILIPGPLHRAAVVGALVERELWELPTQGGSMVQNLALARRAGMYFTPPDVAWHIALKTIAPVLSDAGVSGDIQAVEQVFALRIVDPACGAGIFLTAAFALMMSLYDAAIGMYPQLSGRVGHRDEFGRRLVQEQLIGVDSSERASQACRRLLRSLSGTRPKRIYHADALTGRASRGDPTLEATAEDSARPLDWPRVLGERGADIVLLNPPFGRLRVLRSEFALKSRALRKGANTTALWKQRSRVIEGLTEYARRVPSYEPAKSGVLDWQRLFLARSLALLRAGGRLGAIVPVSIVSDRSASRMRRYLLETTALERIDLLSETAKLFPTVNQPTCVIVATKGGETRRLSISGPVRDLSQLDSAAVEVELAAISRFSPESLSIPRASAPGFLLLERIHRFERLGADTRIRNLRGELDLTLHREVLGRGSTVLLRGDNVERFQVRKGDVVDLRRFRGLLGGTEKRDHFGRRRVVGRQVAFLEKKRRCSFVVAPRGAVVANSCNYLLWEGPNEAAGVHFLAGLLNSALLEWRLRLTSSNNHISNYELDELPIPRKGFSAIAGASLRLHAKYRRAPFGVSEEDPVSRESDLDAAVFRAFDVSRDDAAMVMHEIDARRTDAVLKLLAQ